MIDLASDQPDSLGWQLREMNHLVLPHIKNAVLEAALAATQVRVRVRVRVTGKRSLERVEHIRLIRPTDSLGLYKSKRKSTYSLCS